MKKEHWEAKAFSVGYKPSKKNKHLYYRNDGSVIFFLKFDVLTFEKKNVLTKDGDFETYFIFPLTFKTVKEIPEWQLNRGLKEESKRLSKTGFNVLPANLHGSDYAVTFVPYMDGFCKICNKDTQKNSLLCRECKKKKNKEFIDAAKKYIAKNINQTNSCCICGKKLNIPFETLLWVFCCRNCNKYYFNSVSDAESLKDRILNGFVCKDTQKFLINHHLCYFDEFTIDVCPTCHARIHHSKMIEYKQYKPVDKRILKTNGGIDED